MMEHTIRTIQPEYHENKISKHNKTKQKKNIYIFRIYTRQTQI